MKDIEIGSKYIAYMDVESDKTALAVGSGDVEVLATPVMITLMENAAKEALKPFLEEGETSVGIQINVTHDAASPLNMKIHAEASIIEVNRRIITFELHAYDETGIIGSGTHQRAVLLKDKFIRRAQERLNMKKDA